MESLIPTPGLRQGRTIAWLVLAACMLGTIGIPAVAANAHTNNVATGDAQTRTQTLSTDSHAAPARVGSASVILSAVPRGLRALGKVDSLGKTTLSAPLTGKILGPFRTEGEVAAGTVIARNVPPTLQSSIARVRTDLAIDRAEYARTQQLVAERLRTKIALDRARRSVVRAKEQLDGLRQEAAQEVIRAPFAGALRYLISPGTVVYKGTAIATLSGRATPWVDVHVPPAMAQGVHVGERAKIAATDWSGAGRVLSVGRDARPLGLVQVRVGLSDANPLLPGQWVWVRLIRRGLLAPTVADSAVVMRHGRSMVFVLRDGVAHKVPVRVLVEQNGRAWLSGPLHAGDQVAVTHAARLVEGSRVTIGSVPASGAAL